VSRRRRQELVTEQVPAPGRLWIRYAPRTWPGDTARPWLDLARGELGNGRAGVEGEPFGEALERLPLDDVIYLPPVPLALASERDRVARAHLERGTPVLAQYLPGDPIPEAGCVAVLDLLSLALEEPALAEGRFLPLLPGALPSPRGSASPRGAVWPLLPGLGLPGDRPELVPALQAAGVRWLHPISLELPPAQLRCLAERRGEELGLELFHGVPPSTSAATQAVLEAGFAPFLARPLPSSPLHGAGNLRLAGALALAAEISLLRGEPSSRAQGYLRAARFADRCPHDLEAMVRDGQLAVLPWLEEEPRRLVAEAAGRDPSEMLALLLAGGLGAAVGPLPKVSVGSPRP
jgi:hypothetical protein